jgi:hypothetical protein
MLPNLSILQAMQCCPYKAWRLSKENVISENEPTPDLIKNSPKEDSIALTAWYQINPNEIPSSTSQSKLHKYSKEADQLLEKATSILSNDAPPPFYKISRCSECQFKDSCYKKLQEKECISLLAGMTPKVMDKFRKKGITTITQLSHLFRPRRSRRKPQVTGRYLYELKALAVREQKTFVIQTPDISDNPVSIYLDFEGIQDNNLFYLLGGIIVTEDKPPESFAFWADTKAEEKQCFEGLFALLKQYPEAVIYHYGGYESKAFKKIIKQLDRSLQAQWHSVEKQMVNLLGYLRTHVYPPTYGNGLKEVARFLGFEWTEANADGVQSMVWRREWEETGSDSVKEKLIRYNQDDCLALRTVHQWLSQLATDNDKVNVEQVSKMRRHTPYNLRANPEYGGDFQFISKAAYFNYQRDKIYWRNERKAQTPAASPLSRKPKRKNKGLMVWQPKTVNEIVISPSLKKCPRCGSKRLLQLKTQSKSTKQTDLKFTFSGIRRHVREYYSSTFDCYDCDRRSTNFNLHMMHYGDNLFAFAVNCYVNYRMSNAVISKHIQENFGIWMSPMYLVMNKYVWWQKHWIEEAEYIRKIVLKSPVIHIDETTIKLSGESGYVWVFATTHSVFYHYTQTRKADFMTDLLKGYDGVIISDFYPGYETLQVKHQKCLIHLIRDLNDDQFKNPFDEEYKAIVKEFSTLLKSIIETIDRYGLKKARLSKHITQTQSFYQRIVEAEHSSELSVQYAKRFKKHWDGLWTFLEHDNVPWNNNNAEAAVKAFAQHRRGVKGVMHERGLREYLQMLSVAQTCRYRNISFLGLLRGKRGLWEHLSPESLPEYLPFKQARLYVRRLGFERKADWIAWDKSGKRPSFIPHTPNSVYKKTGWIDWHDWIGFGFLPFTKARTYMRKQKLQTRADYSAWLNSGNRPKYIPRSPEKVYRHTGWKDLSDWLGTTKIKKKNIVRLPYNEAKAYMKRVGIKTQKEFFAWRKSGNRPHTIPSDPDRVYKEFEGWGRFLGTDRIANQKKVFWDYGLAKAFLMILGVDSLPRFRELYALGEIPSEIPKNPYAYYKKCGTWLGYSDFFQKTQVNYQSEKEDI